MAISKITNDGIGDIDELTVDTNTLVVDSTNNRVGIGTSSPLGILHVSKSSGDVVTRYTSGDGDDVAFFMGGQSSGANGRFLYDGSNNMRFYTNSSERMRIDSSGNVLVGQTSADSTVVGIGLLSYGSLYSTRDGDFALTVNRKTSDGNIARFQKDGTTVGSIGVNGSRPYFVNASQGGFKIDNSGSAMRLNPVNASAGYADNIHDIGDPAARWDDIYATNGTIQTSDQNEKQQIASLTDAEITAAKAISKLFKTFKWNDKVEAKGDAARTHTGVIAQDVQQAMTDAGLDAGNYAFFISTTWWETQTEVPAGEADEENGIEAQDAYTRTDTYETAEEAPEGATERTRLGIRYPELLAFVGAATEQRLADIEARIAALEAN